MTGLGNWLSSLTGKGGGAYLWPKTPRSNLQVEAWRRVGYSDLHPYLGRAMDIISLLDEMLENHLLPESFTCLDICCGDALILWRIQRHFGYCQCYGIDLNAGQYRDHERMQRAGVQLYPVALQTLVQNDAPEVFDVAIMLNTWRGWEKADLPLRDKDLPQLTELWLKRNARYFITTAERQQQEEMKQRGWWLWKFGKGEDASSLICAFMVSAPGE